MLKFREKPYDVNETAFDKGFAGALTLSADNNVGEITPSAEYYNPWTRNKTMDKIALAFSVKAREAEAQLVKVAPGGSINTQTGGAGTAGTALIPVFVDPTIVDRTIRETPLRNIFPRRAIRGLTYDYIPLTAKGGAVWATELEAIADQEDTYDRVSVAIKYLYAKGRISGPAVAGMRGFIDAGQLDLSVKAVTIMEAEEEMIINGDASTNPEEPDGLIQLIASNTTSISGGIPSLAQIRAEYATSIANNGFINVAVMDPTTHNYIKGLLQDFQRSPSTNPSVDSLGFGIPGAFEFDGVMFIFDKFMPTTAGSRRILFLDTRYIFIAVLQDLTYEEKASENDSSVYMLKEYLTFVLTHEAACTQMTSVQ